MSNKKIIKEQLARYLDKENIKIEILKKKDNSKIYKTLFLVPVGLVLFILLINIVPRISMKNKEEKTICSIASDGQQKNEKNENIDDYIVYNSLEDKSILPGEITPLLNTTSSSEDIKYFEYDDFDYLVIPYYLYNRQDRDVIYIEDMKECEKHLKYHETTFMDDDQNRSVKIAFSSLYWPAVNYDLNFSTAEKSSINGYQAAIYKKGENLIASFEYDSKYYEIDTTNIPEASFLTTIKSILK